MDQLLRVVNRTLPFLHVGSLQITLTVLLSTNVDELLKAISNG